MRLAVIPARGGSKRIPRKNIKPFHGKPIIAYSVEAALRSRLFDHVIVSTDDAEIAEVAVAYGATAPFTRPAELATDTTATRPVVIHAIEQMEELVGVVDHVCCVYPTAPFLLSSDIRNGYDVMLRHGCEFVFTVTEFRYPIQRALEISDSGEVAMLFPENRYTRSQKLPPAYHDAGQFYWGKALAFKKNLPTFGPGSRPITLPHYRVQDIDTPEDWRHAEMLYQVMQRNQYGV